VNSASSSIFASNSPKVRSQKKKQAASRIALNQRKMHRSDSGMLHGNVILPHLLNTMI
jgi:hypothetical protein